MSDTNSNTAMTNTKEKFRKDYKSYDYIIETVDLTFQLNSTKTVVQSLLKVSRTVIDISHTEAVVDSP